MPYYPTSKDNIGYEYDIYTFWEHEVSKYAGISLLEVEQLDYIDYLVLKRDAFIYKLSQTENGREYLNNAYRLEQTKPDRKKLRNKFGEEG